MKTEFKEISFLSIRLIEECSELIKAISKAERFGWDDCHPDNFPCHSLPKENWCDNKGRGGFMGHTCGKVKTNFDDVRSEMNDINRVWFEILAKKEVK